MRFSQIQYLEPEIVTASIRNDNDSGAILNGQPVFAESYDTADYPGVDAVDYTEGTAPLNTFLGIARSNKSAGLAVGDVGEAVVYGYTDAIVTRRFRAASTDAWSSVAAVAFGAMLIPESVGNYLYNNGAIPGNVNYPAASAASDASFAAGAIGSSPAWHRVFAMQSLASLATAGSATQSGALVYTQRMKVFVRVMG